jgi:predicted nucleic acid-binding protein
VWITTLRSNEIYHRVSLEWVVAWTSASGLLCVPAHFPAEITGVLGRQQLDHQYVLDVLAEILSEPPFAVHPIVFTLGERAARIALMTGIRGSDAVYVALAEHLNVPLVTWDRAQLERTGRIIEVMTPSQALEQMGWPCEHFCID